MVNRGQTLTFAEKRFFDFAVSVKDGISLWDNTKDYVDLFRSYRSLEVNPIWRFTYLFLAKVGSSRRKVQPTNEENMDGIRTGQDFCGIAKEIQKFVRDNSVTGTEIRMLARNIRVGLTIQEFSKEFVH